MLFGQISRTLFLTVDSPASLPDGSVLGLQASHLLLILTNLGYETVLTAACARQGCSATHYYYYHICIIESSYMKLLHLVLHTWGICLLHQNIFHVMSPKITNLMRKNNKTDYFPFHVYCARAHTHTCTLHVSSDCLIVQQIVFLDGATRRENFRRYCMSTAAQKPPEK
jgi:hypothetical protein